MEKRKRGRISFLAADSLGRTTSLSQAGQAGGATVAAKRVDFTFTADSRLESLTRYNSTTAAPANLVASSAFAYDSLGRLSSLSHSKNSTSIATYGFTYDASSQIASISATSQVGASGTSNFSYDATGQLTTTDHTHITDEAYAYDTSGNRTGSGITIGTNNRMSTDGTFNYTYDNEGNLTVRTRISTASANEKTITYTWDHRNRLTSIVYKNNAGTKTKEAIYECDVFDRRTKKSVDLDGAGSGAAVVSRYVYDGEDILATTNSSGTVTSRLLHGPAVDQILAIETASNGTVHWALTDQLGSVRDIVDNSGTVANRIVYDSFGNVASETASSVDYLFGFTGRERDEESDLNYHRARYYSASIGRWLSEDPIGFSAGDTNLRRYVNNNPVNFTDPSGNVAAETQPPDGMLMWLEREENSHQPTPRDTNLIEFRSLDNIVDCHPPHPAPRNVLRELGEYLVDLPIIDVMYHGHYDRQKFNRPPLNETEARILTDPLPPEESIYHKYLFGGDELVKYVFDDGSEGVYSKRTEQLVTDVSVMGTYNYGRGKAHRFVSDMVPYFIWGNSPDDPTGITVRVLGPELAYDLAIRLNNDFKVALSIIVASRAYHQ